MQMINLHKTLSNTHFAFHASQFAPHVCTKPQQGWLLALQYAGTKQHQLKDALPKKPTNQTTNHQNKQTNETHNKPTPPHTHKTVASKWYCLYLLDYHWFLMPTKARKLENRESVAKSQQIVLRDQKLSETTIHTY